MALSHDAISSFVVQYLRGEKLAADDCVAGSTLTRLCQLEFCDGSQATQLEYAEERRFIVACIRRMKMDGVLRLLSLNGARGFRLADPVREEGEGEGGTELREEAEEEEEEGEGEGGTEVREEEDVEGDGHEGTGEYYDTIAEFSREEDGGEEEEVEDEGTPIGRKQWAEGPDYEPHSRQQESIERARHQAAYEAMTRGAVPLPPFADEKSVAQSPSRKRSRPGELAASDFGSSVGSISPQRYANSTPKRSPKRMRPESPLSASRRRSAPSRLNSEKPASLKLSLCSGTLGSREQCYQKGRNVLLNEERKDTSLPYVHDIVVNLREKYPGSSVVPDNGRIKCADCDKSFKPISAGVENHLRSKPHQQVLQAKLANPVYNGAACNDSIDSAKSKDIGTDFPFQDNDSAVFANSIPATNLASLRAQYMAALENEAHAVSVRASVVESRQAASEKRITLNAERLEQLDSDIRHSKDHVKELAADLKNTVETSEDRLGDLLKDIADHLDKSESEIGNRIDEVESRVTRMTESCKSKLGKMTDTIARSDHRNLNHIDDLNVLVTKLNEQSKAFRGQTDIEIMSLQGTNKRYEQAHSDLCMGLSELGQEMASAREERVGAENRIKELEDSRQEFKKLSSRLESRLSESREQKLQLESQLAQLGARVQESQDLHSEMLARVQKLEKQTAESAEHRAQAETRIQELEHANARREEECHDLEAQSQLHTEELQRQRNSNLEFRKTITEQVEANLRHAEKCRQASERAARERELLFEEKMTCKFEALRKAHEAERARSADKTKSMKKSIRELEEDVDRITQGVPLVFQDLQEVKEYVQGFVKSFNAKMAGLKSAVEGSAAGLKEARRSVAV